MTNTAEYRREWAAKNPDKVAAYRQRYREKNRDTIRAKAKEAYLADPHKQRVRDRKRSYGLTPEAFDGMFALQAGLCALCPSVLVHGRGLHVDHCHETKKVRGLLCKRCNVTLGFVKDSISQLEAYIAYLKKHQPASLVGGASA